MLYKIISDEAAFLGFVDWLPELQTHEAFYVTLLARKKYHESAQSDKKALRRFTATSKNHLIQKTKQLEIPLGLYTNKNESPVHQDALALYISVNPRDFRSAQQNLLRVMVDVVLSTGNDKNPAAIAMSEIQKAKSRTCYVDFDFDIPAEDVAGIASQILALVGEDSVRFLRTRGGMHALIEPTKAAALGPKTWYQQITAMPGCDVVGDSLIPVPGTLQGGFTPQFMKHNLGKD